MKYIRTFFSTWHSGVYSLYKQLHCTYLYTALPVNSADKFCLIGGVCLLFGWQIVQSLGPHNRYRNVGHPVDISWMLELGPVSVGLICWWWKRSILLNSEIYGRQSKSTLESQFTFASSKYTAQVWNKLMSFLLLSFQSHGHGTQTRDNNVAKTALG